MKPSNQNDSGLSNLNRRLNRRGFLQHASGGVYGAALASLLSEDLFGAEEVKQQRRSYNLKERKPHFKPKAKAVIQLFMNGGPSQMDLFDPKPELTKRHGESYFDKIAGEVEHPATAGALMASPFKFKQHGKSGMWVSEVLPELAKCTDDITLLQSMYTTNLTHEPAIYKIHGGKTLPGQPVMGSWILYGLGSVNQNMPAYVVLDDPKTLPVNGTQNWQQGYLPPVYQGTRFNSKGSPVLNLKREFSEPDEVTALQRNLLRELDVRHLKKHPGQLALDARLESYELAARMQLAAPEAVDLSKETKKTKQMYGMDNSVTASYGKRCLIARRLVERGVRFIQLFIDGQIWDNHGSIVNETPPACRKTDKPIAGLLKDLKQRGLLDETLVIWNGEFGRLPISEMGRNKNLLKAGRDHNKNAMCVWMAGGGLKPGMTYGKTDDLGFAATENRVSVADWHATILHLLGLDYKKLFYNKNGLDERLTGVEKARIISEIIK